MVNNKPETTEKYGKKQEASRDVTNHFFSKSKSKH